MKIKTEHFYNHRRWVNCIAWGVTNFVLATKKYLTKFILSGKNVLNVFNWPTARWFSSLINKCLYLSLKVVTFEKRKKKTSFLLF